MKFKNPSRAAVSMTAGMLLLAAATICVQQLASAQTNDQTTAKLVCQMIARKHISHAPIDDDVSKRLLARYLKTLDPQKLYLTQADVDDLSKSATVLDDQLKAGNVDFAYSTFKLYLQRLNDRLSKIGQQIDADQDFTIDESIAVDSDKFGWAKSVEELDERWRKRVKYDLLALILDDSSLADARKRLHKRYYNLKTQMKQTERFEQLEIFLTSLAHCFDPHSSYMSKQTLEDFRIQMELKLQGIGAALRTEDGYTVVAQIVPGGAAEKDGRLTVGDKIVGVGQQDEEGFVDIVEMKLTRVVRLIRGPKGTVVRLQIKSEDSSDMKVYELTRQVIELKSAEVKGEIIETKSRVKGSNSRIGVINIPSFYRDFRGAQQGRDDFKSTARDVRKVLADFRDAGGVDAVIIDLRTNGGGALSEAIEVSGLFIDKGPVVQVKDQNGRIRSHDDEDPGQFYTGPLAVICNRLSASASEIFAGAIKDYRRGILIGDKTTHGKGTVQNVMPVSERLFLLGNPADRGALKLTINQFYRVNGDSTQNQGVQSDVTLPSLIDHMDLGESSLDNALAFDHIPAAGYTPEKRTTDSVISQLQKSSASRVSKNSDFQNTTKDIARYLKKKNLKSVSLNLAKRKAEQTEERKKKEDDEDTPEDDGNGPIFPEDFYNDEVLNITLDYLTLLKKLKVATN